MKKLQLFVLNHGLTPLQKGNFAVFLNPCFYCLGLLFNENVTKLSWCILHLKRQKWNFHDIFSQCMTWWYLGVTRGLEGVLRSYWGLQKIFFLSRSSSDTLSLSILHKNKSWINFKVLTKTMELPLWKKVNFAFFVNRCSRSLERLISCVEP